MDKLRHVETLATHRLRKTFQYPSESDDEDAVEAGLDEQDRTALLASLSAHDASTTKTYTVLLLALPLVPALLHTPRLFAPDGFFPALVAIASLLASAYTLYYVPLGTGPGLSEHAAGVVAEYIGPVNCAVCGALALWEVWLGRGWIDGLVVGGGFLPGVVCGLVLWARTELRLVDVQALAGVEKAR